jgi:chemotaxis protein MotB
MSDNDEECPPCKAGSPAWVMTFADLMSLLMCFFVLLLSFATMDVVKFKQMAASLKNAFGVQTEVPVYDVVKGTSVVAQHFSPAMTEPTVVEEVRQTVQVEEHLDLADIDKKRIEKELAEQRKKEAEKEAEKIRESLKDEIKKGLVAVQLQGERIVIRIQEKGSFQSGSAVLNSSFSPIMDKITMAVKAQSGEVIVAGHTDDIPINTEWYRSNWELSSARAVTVAHGILSDGSVSPDRLVVEGHADTQPLVPNDSRANRAANRRVEIVLIRGDGSNGKSAIQVIR